MLLRALGDSCGESSVLENEENVDENMRFKTPIGQKMSFGSGVSPPAHGPQGKKSTSRFLSDILDIHKLPPQSSSNQTPSRPP